jgi:hypothetical protein
VRNVRWFVRPVRDCMEREDAMSMPVPVEASDVPRCHGCGFGGKERLGWQAEGAGAEVEAGATRPGKQWRWGGWIRYRYRCRCRCRCRHNGSALRFHWYCEL